MVINIRRYENIDDFGILLIYCSICVKLENNDYIYMLLIFNIIFWYS